MIQIGTQDRAFFPENLTEKFVYVKEMGFVSYEIDGRLLVDHLDTVREAMSQTGIKILTACNGYHGWIGDIEAKDRQQAVEEISDILRALSESLRK